MAEPYTDSRRLTGTNVFFDATGAALEVAPGVAFDAATLERWRDNIAAARQALGWATGQTVALVHASGASLAFDAPLDQLYAATAANEWAWCDALGLPVASDVESIAGIVDREQALEALAALATREANPALRALQAEADARGVPLLVDEDRVTLGCGVHARSWRPDALPAADAVDWSAARPVPTALVTGSNGKTTTVRLVAAMARAQGWPTAHCCTDGVFFDGELLEGGDFSGPAGARTALRHPRAEAAVLETARGGVLRRGLALGMADAAVVTNVSSDHFGEYGVHDLARLAQAKLVVARAVRHRGLLVLNAEDALLRAQAPVEARIGWFGRDFDDAWLAAHRAVGGATCGVRDGRLVLGADGVEHELGAIEQLPLALGGRAAYNLDNLAAAALAAWAMGVAPDAIAAVASRFGAVPSDNPGRLQRWRFGDADVVVDYAHNADGLHGVLRAIGADARAGRLGVLLGHAGNREDADLRAVASTVAAYRPDRVWLKDIAGYERGRGAGEIAGIMQAQLHADGVDGSSIAVVLDEAEAARTALAWLRAGDLLLLPLHDPAARTRVVGWLDALRDAGWMPGQALPDMSPSP